ncbi:hypothetical protein [Nonomuraea sp. SYSU D8015]|uniref:hypothetical protein n=1 Tax=Nonomuraea sp. SYSU D8015 TaxID=2593644 RepID=UPI001660F5DB|nr:hypothetical protein [Nonomuraea sp. SYSU D8015]
MLADEMRRSQPHEVHMRGIRPAAPPPRGEDRDDDRPARTVHRLRRIRQVSVQAINEIDQALRHRAS